MNTKVDSTHPKPPAENYLIIVGAGISVITSIFLITAHQGLYHLNTTGFAALGTLDAGSIVSIIIGIALKSRREKELKRKPEKQPELNNPTSGQNLISTSQSRDLLNSKTTPQYDVKCCSQNSNDLANPGNLPVSLWRFILGYIDYKSLLNVQRTSKTFSKIIGKYYLGAKIPNTVNCNRDLNKYDLCGKTAIDPPNKDHTDPLIWKARMNGVLRQYTDIFFNNQKVRFLHNKTNVITVKKRETWTVNLPENFDLGGFDNQIWTFENRMLFLCRAEEKKKSLILLLDFDKSEGLEVERYQEVNLSIDKFYWGSAATGHIFCLRNGVFQLYNVYNKKFTELKNSTQSLPLFKACGHRWATASYEKFLFWHADNSKRCLSLWMTDITNGETMELCSLQGVGTHYHPLYQIHGKRLLIQEYLDEKDNNKLVFSLWNVEEKKLIKKDVKQFSSAGIESVEGCMKWLFDGSLVAYRLNNHELSIFSVDSDFSFQLPLHERMKFAADKFWLKSNFLFIAHSTCFSIYEISESRCTVEKIHDWSYNSDNSILNSSSEILNIDVMDKMCYLELPQALLQINLYELLKK